MKKNIKEKLFEYINYKENKGDHDIEILVHDTTDIGRILGEMCRNVKKLFKKYEGKYLLIYSEIFNKYYLIEELKNIEFDITTSFIFSLDSINDCTGVYSVGITPTIKFIDTSNIETPIGIVWYIKDIIVFDSKEEVELYIELNKN